jgi:hypothetical protein
MGGRVGSFTFECPPKQYCPYATYILLMTIIKPLPILLLLLLLLPTTPFTLTRD